MPVLVGAGQITEVEAPPEMARSPIALMADAARKAAADAGSAEILYALDSVVVVRRFSDSSARLRSPFGKVANPPWSVAKRLGADPREMVYTPVGGNMPQVAVNRAWERIAAGESDAALLVGAEALRTELAARRAGLTLDWSEDAPRGPEEWGKPRTGMSAHEAAHGLEAPVHFYPLFEQAIRSAKGRTMAEHLEQVGRLFERFSQVAAANPLATRREGYSAAEIVTPTMDNPLIAFPYTKRMCASMYVDQAAAVLLCSEEKADAFGVPPDKRVYLHGGAQGEDQWFVTERARLDRSPAVRSVTRTALEMAGKTLRDVAAFDLYSCFPSIVEVTREEMGIAEDDPRPLTLTGGLPFFGGPGNNYVMHAIAEMVEWLRRRPGQFGMVTGNGHYITKHAAGLYSTVRPDAPCVRADLGTLQARTAFTERPEGAARVESYTVVHSKEGPEMGIVVGRLLENDVRFLANTPRDRATLAALEDRDGLSLRGTVRSNEGKNCFTLEL